MINEVFNCRLSGSPTPNCTSIDIHRHCPFILLVYSFYHAYERQFKTKGKETKSNKKNFKYS